MLDICQDHARSVVEAMRELALMVDSILENKPKSLKEHYANMTKVIGQCKKHQDTLLEEVASVGSLLISREDFLRLIFRVGEIADYAEGVGFRLSGIVEKKLKVEKKYLTKLSELSTLLLEEMSKLRDTMMTLSLNPGRAIEMSKAVDEIERKVDANYRSLDMDVLDDKMSIPTMLLLRDILENLEKIADIGVDVADLIRVLAVSS